MVSLSTALTIQNNEVFIGYYKGRDSEKGGYYVSHGEARRFHLIISCEPIYEILDIAKAEGEKLITEIKKLDLSSEVKTLDSLIGDSKTVERIIDSSRSEY